MKELTFDYECDCDVPQFYIMKYFADPANIIRYVKSFRSIVLVNEDTWKVEAKWLFYKANLYIRRVIRLNEILYYIEKSDGLLKGSAYIRFVVLPYKIHRKYAIKILFVYEGSLSAFVELLAHEYYKSFKKKFQKEMVEAISQ